MIFTATKVQNAPVSAHSVTISPSEGSQSIAFLWFLYIFNINCSQNAQKTNSFSSKHNAYMISIRDFSV